MPSESHVSAQLDGEMSVYETSVEASADDRQTGIERVTFTLRGADGTVLMQRADEVPPYGLPQLRLPPGAYSLEATARYGCTC